MTAVQLADTHARISVVVEDMVTAFKDKGLSDESGANILEKLETKNFTEAVDICLGYVKSIAYLDHDVMVGYMKTATNTLLDATTIEMKILNRKIKTMDADSKQAGTPAHDKAIAHYAELETIKKDIMVQAAVYRIAGGLKLQGFLDDPNYDAKDEYNRYLDLAGQK